MNKFKYRYLKGQWRHKVSFGVVVMLMATVSYADAVHVDCQFYDEANQQVGEGYYEYDPSVTDKFEYRESSGKNAIFETNYATELHSSITLPAGDGWVGGAYQFTDTISDIWAGDEPGTLHHLDPSPFSEIDSGWNKYPPGKCSGCDFSTLSMNWSTLFEGNWEAGHWHQNNIIPETSLYENHSGSGRFVCEAFASEDLFEVYPDKMGIEGSVSTFVAFSSYNEPSLQYTWTQTEGPAASLTVEEGTQILRVTVPNLDADTVLRFTVSAGGLTKKISLPVLNKVEPIAGGGPTTLYCELTTEAGVSGGTAQFSFDSSKVDVIVEGNMNRPIVPPMVDGLFSTPGKLTDWAMNPVLIAADGSSSTPQIRLESQIIQWYHVGDLAPGEIVKYGSNNVDFRRNGEWNSVYYHRYSRPVLSGSMKFDVGALSWGEASGTYTISNTVAGSVDGTFNCSTNSETSTPETSTPETSTPETSTPETSTPETSTPETSTPETSTPETSTPETSTPETSTPETNRPEEVLSDQGGSKSGGGAIALPLIMFLGFWGGVRHFRKSRKV